jgi:hypothetical protein
VLSRKQANSIRYTIQIPRRNRYISVALKMLKNHPIRKNSSKTNKKDLNSFSELEKQIEKNFYEPINTKIEKLFSILRVIPPKVRPNKSGFIIYSAITDSAPPKSQ